MIYFTAHTFQCVCHCIRTMFRVLGVYNFEQSYKNKKILHNFCLHFARQDGQDGKTQKENHANKVTKRRKYGMNETKSSKIPLGENL